MGIVCHEDGLELGLGEIAPLDQAAGQAQIGGGFIRRNRGRDRGHRDAFDERRGMLLGPRDLDPLRAVAGIDVGDRRVFARRVETGEGQGDGSVGSRFRGSGCGDRALARGRQQTALP